MAEDFSLREFNFTFFPIKAEKGWIASVAQKDFFFFIDFDSRKIFYEKIVNKAVKEIQLKEVAQLSD